ncbi:MAG: cytochrome c3 family protein [Pyrinomonadaceae bacterium]
MSLIGMLEKANTHGQAERNPVPALRLFEAFILLCCLLLFGYALVVGFSGENGSVPESEPVMATEVQDKDYSRFTHSNDFHSRLPCLLCHRRDDNSARIGFPGKSGHLPCAGCHALQFSDNMSPICTICHTSTGMKRFPGLRSFGVKFVHSKHMRTNCVTCHKPQGRGVAKSIPSGPSAHTTCFQCHSSKTSFAMSSCGTCHQPGRLIRTSESAIAFRKGFSHAKHSGNKTSNCTTCHTIRAGSARGKQVTAPLASMHFAPAGSQSCGGCHNGKRAFGPDDFVNCKRCHQANTFKF